MLAQVVNFSVFKMRHVSVLKLLQRLVRVRIKRGVAKKCRVEQDKLVLTTDKNKLIRYSSEGILVQLERLPPKVSIPALVDLLHIYDQSRFLTSRVLWQRFCAKGSDAAMFAYSRKQGTFQAVTAKELKLRPEILPTTVVKRLKGSLGVKTQVQPSKPVQAALVAVLRKLVDGDA